MDYTITESFTLPSHGKIYKQPVEERVSLRAMTTQEEMRRLSHTDTPYKTICDIIDACTLNEVGISSYDMCLGDQQFLLYKLRTITYGPEYPNLTTCPFCNTSKINKINLDTLEVLEYKEKEWEKENPYVVTLPVTKKVVKLRYETGRILDKIALDKEKFSKIYPDINLDTDLLFTLKHSIVTIDGQVYDEVKLEEFIKNLNMRDTNSLSKAINRLNNKIGIMDVTVTKCSNSKCNKEYLSPFRLSSEFFRPTED